MQFEDLTPEQQEKVKALKTPEEAMAFIKDEGIELTQEELDQIAGGGPRFTHWAWED